MPRRNGQSSAADASGDSDREQRFQNLKKEIHKNLITRMDLSSVGRMDDYELRRELRRGIEELCDYRADLISQAERNRLIDEVIDETLGLGPIDPLLRDPTISDILINGPKTVYVERRGRLERTNVKFHDDQHLLEIVQRIAGRAGRRLDESSPMVDTRLEDGSRVNAIIAPLALDGALVSIRRFGAQPLLAGDLIARESATAEMIDFLEACVRARLNIMISGGTGSGKTTFLNLLSAYIPEDERVATIEDAAELQLQQPHVARMETRPENVEGKGLVTARDLLRNSLRMRPDRIIIGECRGEEAFDMLQAMTTGHDGSLTTIHANAASKCWSAWRVTTCRCGSSTGGSTRQSTSSCIAPGSAAASAKSCRSRRSPASKAIRSACTTSSRSSRPASERTAGRLENSGRPESAHSAATGCDRGASTSPRRCSSRAC